MRRELASILATSIVLASGAALADPFALHGTQPHDLDAQTPPEDVVNKCQSCHAGGVDDDGKAYRPWDTWSGTMMANAVRDPLYLAALTVANQDTPGIGELCLRCHSPEAWVRGDTSDGFGAMLTDDDREGVACEGCHRSIDPSATNPPIDPNGPYAGDSQLFWDPGPSKHGPYDNADSPAHATALDPFTSSSKLCGQCHEVDNPAVDLVDDQDQDTGIPFPLDTTFTEWSSSAYASGAQAKGCVDCHMPASKGDLMVSTFPTAMTRHDPPTHLFAAANVWGIELVKASDAALAQTRALAFKQAEDAANATLANAVKVEITSAPSQALPGDTIAVSARVTNLAGHRFPTGYADGRRAFLRVEIVDASEKTLAIVGAYDDANHALEQSAELHVYEAVQEEMRVNGPPIAWHLSKSNHIAKDTRIPPLGFVPGPTTPIVGADYSDGNGGVNNFDDATVHLAIPKSASGELTVRASVLYQSTEAELVDELSKSDTTDDRGTTLASLYAATGYAAPTTIAKAEQALMLPSMAVASSSSSTTTSATSGVGGAGGASTTSGAGGASASPSTSSGCGCSFPDRSPEGFAALLATAALAFGARRRRIRE